MSNTRVYQGLAGQPHPIAVIAQQPAVMPSYYPPQPMAQPFPQPVAQPFPQPCPQPVAQAMTSTHFFQPNAIAIGKSGVLSRDHAVYTRRPTATVVEYEPDTGMLCCAIL